MSGGDRMRRLRQARLRRRRSARRAVSEWMRRLFQPGLTIDELMAAIDADQRDRSE